MRVTALREVQSLLGGEGFPLCESPSLRLEKYVRLGDNTKRDEIDAVVRCQGQFGKPIPPIVPKGAERFVAKLESRLIINQAGGILENAGLCLHPHFGTPYIPGSAVKGIARHAAWCEWNEEPDETRKADIANRIAQTFGYPTGDKDGLDAYLAVRGWDNGRNSGSVAFLPAVPVDKSRLVTDIVNCHHPNYYAGKKTNATDDESPNPQFFPAIEESASFIFTLVPLKGDVRALADAKKWLIQAITCMGIGAKTGVGYGWFDYSESNSNEVFKRIARKEQLEQLNRELDEAIMCLKSMRVNYPDGKILDPQAVAVVRQSALDAQGKFKGLGKVQSLLDLANTLIRQIPQETPLERIRREWENAPANLKAILNGDDLQRFETRSAERKTNIVLLLREMTGRGAEVWNAIRSNQKKFGKVEQIIRTYCKGHPELFPANGSIKQGKMP